MSDRVELIWYGDDAPWYDHGPQHPLRPARVILTRELIKAYGIVDGVWIVETPARDATDDELRLVHTDRYIDATKRAGHGEPGPWKEFRYGPGDNPIFPDMHEAASRVAGASVVAAEAVLTARAEHAFNPAGGLHHAMPERASGFCVYDDPAVAIAWMLANGAERIAYVDVDVHHGDGVQAIFYGEPRVLTISLHQTGRTLFPGTGFVDEFGSGEAKGTKVNVPLPPYTGDDGWLRAFEDVVPPLVPDPEAAKLLVPTQGAFDGPAAFAQPTAVAPAAVADDLVLDAAAALVELGVGQFHEVERVGHECGVAQAVFEGLAVGAGEVEHAVADGGQPVVGAGVEPGAGPGGALAGDEVEELGAGAGGCDVDDRSRPVLGAPAALAAEQRLVQAQGADLADAARVVDQRGAVGDHGVVDRVPIAAQLPGHLGDRSPKSADLLGDPPAGPVRHGASRRGDPRVLPRERPGRAVLVGAEPAVLVPHQPSRPPEARQVSQLHHGPLLHPRRLSARPASDRPAQAGFHVHPQRNAGLVLHAENMHIGKADKEFTDARRVSLHRGSRASVG